jgi:DNA-binding NtrC family response regulator
MQAKAFREDLFYRLNVLTIAMPTLRERSEDIPLLAGHFFRMACREMGLAEKEVDPEVMHWLAAQSWPGNVRELQNFVRRLTVFAATERVDMNLLRVVRQGGCVPVLPNGAMRGSQAPLGPYKVAKAEAVTTFTQSYVNELLTQTKGNVSEAARISGLSRVALQKILSRMGESAARFRD